MNPHKRFKGGIIPRR